ncbi:MAG: hypothetical protein V1676_00865 [Candidatus Diapherotrites archaeon]
MLKYFIYCSLYAAGTNFLARLRRLLPKGKSNTSETGIVKREGKQGGDERSSGKKGQYAPEGWIKDVVLAMGKFPLEETQNHAHVVMDALKSKEVGWGKVRPSIEYLKEFIAQIERVGEESGKSGRNFLRSGAVVPAEFAPLLERVVWVTDECEMLVERVRRKKGVDDDITARARLPKGTQCGQAIRRRGRAQKQSQKSDKNRELWRLSLFGFLPSPKLFKGFLFEYISRFSGGVA